MLIDFQQHYTPPELLKGEPGKLTADLDRDGNPHYLLNPLLADLPAHVRMMDTSGIDAGDVHHADMRRQIGQQRIEQIMRIAVAVEIDRELARLALEQFRRRVMLLEVDEHASPYMIANSVLRRSVTSMAPG